MRISRIYLPIETPDIDNTINIAGDKAHYIRNVLRLKVGFTLHFFTPNGNQYQAKVGHISKHQVELVDISLTEIQPKNSSLKTTLAQGISSSDRMDYSIQKAAELGCSRIIPFISDFCSQKIPVHKFEKKLNHWQAVAISACEQSGRSSVMEITPIIEFSPLVKEIDNGIYLDPTADHFLYNLPKSLQQAHTFFIGPEGGFSPEELDAFEKANYLGVQLGQRVLRTETVAPVIMGAMHALYGDFKPLVE
ncbi:16S rRNA (uracil(1498)-N(3))-methyltransferase [Marinicella litoralis]|uniref:Ribosomal RNA small subunit methyltransferase E n=1 Tax=Marinicella litoralis TaxID=644220 RepID=A0A4R6XN20_9GAMM|nr:16S rRNA (uracil(1498)-N(3))-methyltransferase [Marinicella litoralis]TDR19520.1 16S rRNA m(3)U-1498 methyltransferase [Marinicella litoralis]